MGKRPTSVRSLRARLKLGREEQKKPSKYRNKKVTVDGIKFDSLLESKRYQELDLMVRAEVIRDLNLQVAMILRCGGTEVKSAKGRTLKYYADFSYWDIEQGRQRWEDSKGYDTPLSALKRAMIKAEYGIEIEIVR